MNIPFLAIFSYAVNEALHLSKLERQIIMDCLAKIEYELKHAIDKPSRKLIATNIDLFLDYCSRFYDRQFITRDHVHKGVLEKFESLLNSYFSSNKPKLIGLPSVTWSANELNLSPKYFGDLVKKETGKSAQEYIQSKVIDVAKERIWDSNIRSILPDCLNNVLAPHRMNTGHLICSGPTDVLQLTSAKLLHFI